jgi:hypothetical protein
MVEVWGRVTTQLFETGTVCEDMMGRFEGNAAETAPWLVAVVQSCVEVNGGVELIASGIELNYSGIRGSSPKVWVFWRRMRVV